MSEEHTIHVLRRHIDEGLKSDCNRCPVALALHEHTGLPHVSAGPTALIASSTLGNFAEFYAQTPQIVRKFMAEFDNGEVIAPFNFTVKTQDYKLGIQ